GAPPFRTTRLLCEQEIFSLKHPVQQVVMVFARGRGDLCRRRARRSNIPSRLHRCSLLAAPLRDILLSALFSRTHRFPLSFRFGPSAFRRPVLAYYGLC